MSKLAIISNSLRPSQTICLRSSNCATCQGRHLHYWLQHQHAGTGGHHLTSHELLEVVVIVHWSHFHDHDTMSCATRYCSFALTWKAHTHARPQNASPQNLPLNSGLDTDSNVQVQLDNTTARKATVHLIMLTLVYSEHNHTTLVFIQFGWNPTLTTPSAPTR